MAAEARRKDQSNLSDQLATVLGRAGAVECGEAAIRERAFDWWPVMAKSRQQGHVLYPPEAIVFAETASDISKVLSWASAHSTPVTTRGLGSSVVGGPLAVKGGVVLDTTRMTKVISVDTTDMMVTVEAGKNGGELEDELQKQGLTLGHSPQSLYRSTVGGWIATRATGQFSSKFGGIEDLVTGFKAVLADGSIVDFGPQARMAVGPDLRHIIIGSEGCLGVVTQVTLKVFPLPEATLFDTITFPDLESGLKAMRTLMQARLRPSLLRFYDVAEARHAMKDKAFPLPVMFIGTEGVKAVAEAEMRALLSICTANGGTSIGPDGALGWMGRRFDFSTIEKVLDQPTGVAETIEVSNHWSRIGKTYDAMTKALAPFVDEVLGHFSHAYTDGISLYVILIGKAGSAAESEKTLREIWKIAMENALATGATVSHHHGSGLARTQYVAEGLGSSFAVLERVKAALDPAGILNPGKLGLK